MVRYFVCYRHNCFDKLFIVLSGHNFESFSSNSFLEPILFVIISIIISFHDFILFLFQKSSFSKFDALQKKNILHVRSSDAGKAQEKFNVILFYFYNFYFIQECKIPMLSCNLTILITNINFHVG